MLYFHCNNIVGSAKLSLTIKSNNFNNASKQLRFQCSRIQLAHRKPWCSGGLLTLSLVIMTIMKVIMMKTMTMITSERILNLKVALLDHTVLSIVLSMYMASKGVMVSCCYSAFHEISVFSIG